MRSYYQRLADSYGDATKHTKMDRNKSYYGYDHFRFRKGYDTGTPIAWIDWDKYIDSNIDKSYASGSGATDGDGVFNEMRGFLYAIPEMAEKMVTKQMGITGDPAKELINEVAKALFVKNAGPMERLLTMQVDATNPNAEYVSMTCQMLEIIPLRTLTKTGIGDEDR